jgi:hypothetical protein
MQTEHLIPRQTYAQQTTVRAWLSKNCQTNATYARLATIDPQIVEGIRRATVK